MGIAGTSILSSTVVGEQKRGELEPSIDPGERKLESAPMGKEVLKADLGLGSSTWPTQLMIIFSS